MVSSRQAVFLGALACLSFVLAVVALTSLASHPSVHARSTGEDFPCLATYDIVLNNAYNDPDGFPPLPGERIGARCVAAAHKQFRISLISGSAAVAFALVTGASALAFRRRHRALHGEHATDIHPVSP